MLLLKTQATNNKTGSVSTFIAQGTLRGQHSITSVEGLLERNSGLSNETYANLGYPPLKK